MVDLVPPVEFLGHAAPVLGPWFSRNTYLIPDPNDDLSVNLEASLEWLPPTGGLLSLAIASNIRPEILGSFKDASGSPAFADGSLVALFRILPEIEERLDELTTRFIPSADQTTLTTVGSVRQRVRHFAVEIPNGDVLDPDIWDLEPAVADNGGTDEEQARGIGLEFAAGKLINPSHDPDKPPVYPMTDLKRPGRYDPPLAAAANAMPRLLKIGNTQNSRLWCFDHRGRPIDPGAVASWWTQLTNLFSDFDQLWGPGITTAIDRRIADSTVGADLRRVHLVAPNEGPLTDELDSTTVSNANGVGILRTQVGVGGITISNNSQQLPIRVAMLPNGTYVDQLTLWPPGNTSPPRDMVRVGVVNLDRHLVGDVYPTDSTQAKARVRPEVLVANGPVLLASTEEANRAILDVMDGNGDRRLVTSVLERDFGSLSPPTLPVIASADFPNQINNDNVTVVALEGGGEATGQTVAAQRVLVDITFPAVLAGAWVRCWPQDFDEEAARHIRLDGGAGIIAGDGRVRLVVQLPAGVVSSAAQMGLEVMLVASASSQIYNDVRFDRPTPVAGDPIAISAATGSLLLCEQGQVVASVAGLSNPGLVTPGTTIVSLSDPPALVTNDSLQLNQLAEPAIIRRLTAGSTIALTTPAYKNVPVGASVARLSTEGAQVSLTGRDGDSLLTEPGAPLPGLERLEIVCAKEEGNQLDAAVGATPALGRYHELSSHSLSHPGAPGATEFHGTGVRISGAAAKPFVEYLRDRTIPGLQDRVQAALNPAPNITPVSGPSVSIAMLRTVAPGVEGEPALTALLTTQDFPYGEPAGAGTLGLPPAGDEVLKVINRRVHTTEFGAQDGLHSLINVIDRAEDLIYIESPAIDDQEIRNQSDGTSQSIWSRLQTRLEQVPGLHVLINIPSRLAPGTPRRLEAMRNELFLKLDTHPRIEVFSTGVGAGRSLRLASTSVIVDDAYAMTGTTHLWRRGLTYDSSLAVSIFDDRLVNGRPQEISQFRRSLIADRLSLNPIHLPDDPAELLLTIAQLKRRNAGNRLSAESMRLIDIESTQTDINAWNPDGSINDGFNFAAWFASLAAIAQLVNSADGDLAG